MSDAQQPVAQEQTNAQVNQDLSQQSPSQTPPASDQGDDWESGLDVVRAPQRQQPQAQQPQAPQSQEPPAQETAAQQPQQVGQPAQVDQTASEPAAPLSDRDKALQTMFGVLSGDTPPAPIEVPKEVLDWAQKVGYKPEDLTGIPALRKSVADAQKVQTDFEAITRTLTALPQPLQIAISEAANGGDWKKAVTNTHDGIDLTKPFDRQDLAEVINAFAPGRVSKEDFDAAKDGDEDAKKRIDITSELAQERFNRAADEQNNYFAKRDESLRQQQQKYTASLDYAINELQRQNPGVQALLPEIRQELTPEGVHALFFEKDGTLRPDSASAFIFTKYRQELVESTLRRQARAAKDEAELQQISRTNERPTQPVKNEVRSTPALTPEQANEQEVDAFLRGDDLMR